MCNLSLLPNQLGNKNITLSTLLNLCTLHGFEGDFLLINNSAYVNTWTFPRPVLSAARSDKLQRSYRNYCFLNKLSKGFFETLLYVGYSEQSRRDIEDEILLVKLKEYYNHWTELIGYMRIVEEILLFIYIYTVYEYRGWEYSNSTVWQQFAVLRSRQPFKGSSCSSTCYQWNQKPFFFI